MASLRPVQVHYAGGRVSHCAYVHTAIVAAFKRILYGYHTRAVIIVDDKPVAEVYRLTERSVSVDYGRLSKEVRQAVQEELRATLH